MAKNALMRFALASVGCSLFTEADNHLQTEALWVA